MLTLIGKKLWGNSLLLRNLHIGGISHDSESVMNTWKASPQTLLFKAEDNVLKKNKLT